MGLDLSGHGHSEEPPQPNWSVFQSDVVSAANTLGDGIVGVGHSLGASALLGAAASDPRRFAALYCYEPIVIDDAMPDRPPSGANAQLARRRRAEFSSRKEALERFSDRPPFLEFDRSALAGYLEDGLVDKPDGSVRLSCRPEFEAQIYESAADYDVLGLLRSVSCPVTVAFGTRSEVMSRAGAEVVATRLADARVESVPGLDHFGPFSSPLVLADAISHWLRTPAA